MTNIATTPCRNGESRRKALLVLAFTFACLLGAEIRPPANLDTSSWILIDYPNGTVLYERNADKIIPPASLTKLMTLHLAYKAIEQGSISRETLVNILPRHTSGNIPYGSSLMYLEPGYKIRFIDLMKGAAIPSGNDACYVIAEILAGSVERFAQLMNKEAKDLGFQSLSFIEPTGLSEQNTATARDLANFARYYISEHPTALMELHSIPYAEVTMYGSSKSKTLSLKSTNDLLSSVPGCDGLKTGYIRESGYNFIATAKRGDTRFILVTMGGAQGTQGRSRTGTLLLDWAFDTWETVEFPSEKLGKVRVWFGKESWLYPVMQKSNYLTFEKRYRDTLTYKLIFDEISAPIAKGTQVGKLLLLSGNDIVGNFPLFADKDVPRGNIFIAIRDFFSRLAKRLFTPKA